MEHILFIIVRAVYFLVTALQVLIFVRALLSLFMLSEDSIIVSFVYTITEIVVLPVRNFLEKFSFFNAFPIDLSLILSFVAVSVVQMILGYFLPYFS